MTKNLKPLNHKGTQIIKTERLILRAFKVSDANDFFEFASDLNVNKYLSYEPHATPEVSENLLKDWVKGYESNETYNWAIELDNKVVGTVSVIKISNKRYSCELGWQLAYSCWNKGYMTEAVQAVVDFLFGVVGFNRIAAGYHAENIGSGRVMEKVGMTFEGVERQFAPMKDGTFADKRCMAILKEEWVKLSNAR